MADHKTALDIYNDTSLPGLHEAIGIFTQTFAAMTGQTINLSEHAVQNFSFLRDILRDIYEGEDSPETSIINVSHNGMTHILYTDAKQDILFASIDSNGNIPVFACAQWQPDETGHTAPQSDFKEAMTQGLNLN
ncbi:MAG TPA: hypothetical protein VGF14_07265 [Alphaproteobacteria bacterium]